MNKISSLLCAAATVVAISAPAVAADMRMPMKAAPMVAPIFSWTGFYIGGFVGGAVAERNAVSTEPCTVVGCVSLFTVAGVVTNNSYDLGSSFIGGGTIGYNWQMPGSQWVIGLEGEVGYLNLERSVRDINSPAAPAVGGVDSTKLGDWYGVIAGRLGFAFDRVLVYGKGGVAFVDKSYGYSVVAPGINATINASDTQTTWAAGAGIEWAFAPNWSLKGEYLYIDTRETFTTAGTVTVGAATAAIANIHTDPGIHTGKLGVNYRF